MVKPILFNTDMVRAILDDRKTATRRVVRPRYQANEYSFQVVTNKTTEERRIDTVDDEGLTCRVGINPPYQPGDILYVRETWCSGYDGEAYFYLADKNTEREQSSLINYDDRRWRPSIHMPKEAARIWLKVTDVRVERLRSMKLNDFLDEGVVICPEAYNDPENAYWQAKQQYIDIWDHTFKSHADIRKYGWAVNPWVWVIEFERCEKPESEEK